MNAGLYMYDLFDFFDVMLYVCNAMMMMYAYDDL